MLLNFSSINIGIVINIGGHKFECTKIQNLPIYRLERDSE